MDIIVILGKILVVLSYAWTIKMVLDFRNSHNNVKIKFDLLSSIELSFAFGLSLASILAKLTPETNVFNLILCLISIVWVNIQRYRILLSSDDAVLMNGKEVKYSKIVRAYPRLVFLCVTTKTEQMKIYSPLTSQEITQTVYNAVKK